MVALLAFLVFCIIVSPFIVAVMVFVGIAVLLFTIVTLTPTIGEIRFFS